MVSLHQEHRINRWNIKSLAFLIILLAYLQFSLVLGLNHRHPVAQVRDQRHTPEDQERQLGTAIRPPANYREHGGNEAQHGPVYQEAVGDQVGLHYLGDVEPGHRAHCHAHGQAQVDHYQQEDHPDQQRVGINILEIVVEEDYISQ